MPPSPSSLPTKEWLKRHCTSLPKCKEAHAFLLRSSLFQDPQLSSKLFSFLPISSPSSTDIAYVTRVFSQLQNPDSFIWNSIIRAHARGPTPSHAIPFFLAMRRSVPPDHHTYPFVLTAVSSSRRLPLGLAIHAGTIKLGLSLDTFVTNSLIQMYASCDHPDDARRLFDECPHRDVVTWNTIIKGCLTAGSLRHAFRLFDDMLETETFRPDAVTVTTLVSACARLGDLGTGRRLHSFSQSLGLLVTKNLNLSNAILDMYCKCGDLVSARELFDSMEERDVLTWTGMISGFADSGNFQGSLELFRRMQRDGVRPDGVILVAVVSVCARMGALDQGKYVHSLLERFEIKRDVVIETALVDMYAKCGNVDLAVQVFEEMKKRNVFTWNAMIGGFAIHGLGGYALELFKRMKREGMAPDDVTFIGLLSACSHSGSVGEGLEIFEEMKRVFKIEPRMEHYGCVVDLFCRAKLAKDALAFVENMPVRPNVILWASLIAACRAHGDSELAERIGRRVVELEPESCDRYVMLSNLYAGSGRWDDASGVRDLMKARGIGKTPGVSWIEHGGTVHQFVAGDRRHYETEKIYVMVEEMCLRVRAEGHVAGTGEVLFNIEEEEKEHSLFLHSEKLAVAFGLMSTSPGPSIRITKNLRVCGDCHSFLKVVSKVFDREIIARDRSRFHHFREGLCSCNDYW